jgi:hypothetical protein
MSSDVFGFSVSSRARRCIWAIECTKSPDFRGPFLRFLRALAEYRNGWLAGAEGSNLRMAESKSSAYTRCACLQSRPRASVQHRERADDSPSLAAVTRVVLRCGPGPKVPQREPTRRCILSCCLKGLNGGRTRARTWDPMIKSHLLYQLSYAPGTGRESLHKRASFSKAIPRCPAME